MILFFNRNVCLEHEWFEVSLFLQYLLNFYCDLSKNHMMWSLKYHIFNLSNTIFENQGICSSEYWIARICVYKPIQVSHWACISTMLQVCRFTSCRFLALTENLMLPRNFGSSKKLLMVHILLPDNTHGGFPEMFTHPGSHRLTRKDKARTENGWVIIFWHKYTYRSEGK